MKIFTPTKSLAAAFGLALALPAFCPAARAQVAAQPPRPGLGARRAARPRGDNLIQRLNLTPAQRLQLREIRSQGEPEARELARRMRLARRALDQAIYADAAEDTLVEQRARELAAAQAALVRLRAATELKVRRVLTAEQLQTFRELRRQAQRRQLLQRRRPNAGPQAAPAEPEPDADAPADPPTPRGRKPLN
ncbi:MAG: Spy/CpxP family protein refolding chaperone [Acidobacteria bacterium]|nr:Spy/CpxP family protein refolding chaperone [Acidobacteriota bacterium]